MATLCHTHTQTNTNEALMLHITRSKTKTQNNAAKSLPYKKKILWKMHAMPNWNLIYKIIEISMIFLFSFTFFLFSFFSLLNNIFIVVDIVKWYHIGKKFTLLGFLHMKCLKREWYIVWRQIELLYLIFTKVFVHNLRPKFFFFY